MAEQNLKDIKVTIVTTIEEDPGGLARHSSREELAEIRVRTAPHTEHVFKTFEDFIQFFPTLNDALKG